MSTKRVRDIVVPSKALVGQQESQYHQKIAQKLTEVTSKYHSSSVIFSKMRGAFPSDVIEYSTELKMRCRSANNETASLYDPQLHALHYEWYFTSACAREVSREFVSGPNLTICMGVPTIASAAIAEGKQVVFIDKNARCLTRFPELMGASEVHLMDAVEARRVGLRADALIFDPPWYAGDTLAWLEVASHLVRPGGTIVFALYPSLVRPTAKSERDLILEVSSTIGRVQLVEDALVYETPLFELEALKACELYCAGNWRHGDLAIITNTRPITKSVPVLPRRSEVDGQWKTFVIGSQVVKVRNCLSDLTEDSGHVFLSSIGKSFVLPTVSARNDTREAIHVWTSKNRVARVSNASALLEILGRISEGASVDSAVRLHEGQFGKDIRDQLNVFLQMEN